MPLAGRWTDLVLGVDVHLELVPGSPAPTPFPHPFVAPVYDPAAMLMAELRAGVPGASPGPVTIGGMPAMRAADPVRMPVPHVFLPPGVMWGALPPGSDAELLFGSATVTMGGHRPVRTGELAMSCSDPVRLPTASVLAIPTPRPVMVGGPPVLDAGATPATASTPAATSVPPRTTWGETSPTDGVPLRMGRARDMVPKQACVLTGHPVNVANGCVMTDAVDLVLDPGEPLTEVTAVVFERTYSSNWAGRTGPLGPGWSHGFGARLWIESHAVVLLTADGREVEFCTLECGIPRVGASLGHPVEGCTLLRQADDRWVVMGQGGETMTLEGRQEARLTSLAKSGGPEVFLRYDASGQLVDLEVGSGGPAYRFEYESSVADGCPRLLALWGPAPGGGAMQRLVQYVYSRGRLAQARAGTQRGTQYAYDGNLMVTETDPTGVAFHYRYDGYGRTARCVETWGVDPREPDPGVYHHRLDYDRTRRRTIVTDGLGSTTVYAFDANLRLAAVTDPMGFTTTYERDAQHRVIEHTDALGQVTRVRYDKQGREVERTGPDSVAMLWTYDDQGRPLCLEGSGGTTWRWTYDATGRLQATTDPLGRTTNRIHEGRHVAAVIDPQGHQTQFAYDETGHLRTQTLPSGAQRQWRRDGAGRVLVERDPRGTEATSTYDAAGRCVRTDSGDNDTTESAFDDAGSVVRVRDATTDESRTYGPLGRLRTRTRGRERIEYRYDAEGRLIGIDDCAGRTAALERDARGDVVALAGFDGRRTRFDRDPLGRIAQVTRPSDARIRYTHDAAGRVVEVGHDDGTTLRYAYRADGALQEASLDETTTRFDCDALGRVVAEHGEHGTVEIHRDHAGRTRVIRGPHGVHVEFLRDPMGRITKVVARSDAARWETTRTLDAGGAPLDTQVPGGIRSYWWRDAAGRPTQHYVGSDEQPLRLRRYAWDPGGRLRQLDDDHASSVTPRYDAWGRWIAPAEAARAEHVLDPDGRVSQRRVVTGTLALSWDDADHLRRVEGPDGAVSVATYDAFGRRIAREDDGRVTRWLWAGDTPLLQWAPDASEPILWVLDPDGFEPLARLCGSQTWSVVADHRGAPLCLVDGDGTLAWSCAADVLHRGNVEGDASLCPWRLPGQCEDPTSLRYNRWRTFDPASGRYLSPDPLGLRAGLDVYAYVDDPLTQSDPLGLLPCGAQPARGGAPTARLDLDPRPRSPYRVGPARPGRGPGFPG